MNKKTLNNVHEDNQIIKAIKELRLEGKGKKEIENWIRNNIEYESITKNLSEYVKRALYKKDKIKNSNDTEENIIGDNNIDDIILEIYNDLKLKGVIGTKSISLIKSKIKNDFNIILDNGEIIDILKRMQSVTESEYNIGNSINELNNKIDSVDKYIVKEGNYIFKIKKTNGFGEIEWEDISIPVKLVDGMFYDFSRHGANMSGQEVLQKFRLRPEVFNALKNRLKLYKSSNIISPYTLENSDEGELENIINNGVTKSIQDKYKDKFVKSYDKIFEDKAKDAFKKLGNIENVISLIKEGIKDLEPVLVDRNLLNKNLINRNSSVGIYCSSDYHFGEDDDEILENRCNEMFEDMINSDESIIHWISLGDLGETFLEDGMHSGQALNMRKNPYELVKYIYTFFSSKIASVAQSGKKIIIDWQGGNHDRGGKTNDMDRGRIFALMIGEMLELSLKNFIEQGMIEFTNHVNPTIRRKVGNLGFIANHGDGVFAKLKNDEILAKFGFGIDTYHVILQGDKHHYIVKQGTNSINVTTSSVKSGGQYAENVIYKDSAPGYVKIKETNKSKKAIIELRMFDE